MKVKVKLADGTVAEGLVESVTDPTEPPEGFLSEDDFEGRFTEQLARRTKSLEAKAATKFLADDGFKEKALAAWGINLAELAKGGELNAERLAQLKAEWEKSALEPVAKEKDTYRTKLDTLLAKKLDQDILAAAREVGIRPEFLKPLTPGATPMIVAALRSQFDYDPEHDDFFEKDGKRPGEFAFSAKPSGEVPYRTIGERLKMFAEDKANADYLERQKPKGPNFQGGGAGRGGDVVISSSQASDHAQFTAAEKMASEQGGRVIVQD